MDIRVGDIFAKLARGEKLADSEILLAREELNLSQDTSAITKGWIGSDGNPNFRFLRSDQAEFSVIPFGTLFVRANSYQSIPNNSGTAIDFTSEISSSSMFVWNSTVPNEIKLNISSASRVGLLCGSVQFSANSSGRRAVGIASYDDTTGAFYQLIMGVSFVPASSTASVIPFAVPFVLSPTRRTVKIIAHQDSGSVLTIPWADVAFMLIR